MNALALRGEWRGNDDQILFHPRFGEFHCLYKNGKVSTITTDQARFKTPEGIGVGSHINDVKAKCGEPDQIAQVCNLHLICISVMVICSRRGATIESLLLPSEDKGAICGLLAHSEREHRAN